MYREHQETDFQTVADFSNINRLRELPIWCRTSEWTSERVAGFFNLFDSKNGAVSLAHEENGELICLFAGWEYKNHFVFELGVINPELSNYMDIWREDAAKAFKMAIDRGNQTVHIKLTDDQVEIVPWMENEVGMVRREGKTIWDIDSSTLSNYINQYIQP